MSLCLLALISGTAVADKTIPVSDPAVVVPASLEAPNPIQEAPAFLSKKDSRLKEKAESLPLSVASKKLWQKKLRKRVGKHPTRIVNIYNKWTLEFLPLNAWSRGKPPKEITDEFLRCHFTNHPTDMDPRLFPVLLQAAQKFKVRRVDVVSGFRDPKYNLSLRKKGRQVARNSKHTLGHAVDFRLPGIDIDLLHEWARSLKLGGVGFYKHSRFIHVDVGHIRFWNGT
ncbi:MAG: YcbK family protein [Kofleriaceae bacterium]|nr:YcbK family protein [Kofleriaceae bacterium]